LFTATAWPTFIAGAETKDSARQEWVAQRFRQLWEIEPWGLIKGALGVLERIWVRRRRNRVAVDADGTFLNEKKRDGDWIKDLRGKGVDWLIV
jgi:hypothetical protein